MASAGQTQTLNARVLRFRAQPELEDACALAEDLLAAGRHVDARAIASSAQQQQRPVVAAAPLLVLEGRAWFMERDLSRAQAALVKAIKHDPQSPAAYRWLGAVLIERGDAARGARAFERALELSPQDPELRRLLQRAREGETVRSVPAATAESLRAMPAAENHPPVAERTRTAEREPSGGGWVESSDDGPTAQFKGRAFTRNASPLRSVPPGSFAAASERSAPDSSRTASNEPGIATGAAAQRADPSTPTRTRTPAPPARTPAPPARTPAPPASSPARATSLHARPTGSPISSRASASASAASPLPSGQVASPKAAARAPATPPPMTPRTPASQAAIDSTARATSFASPARAAPVSPNQVDDPDAVLALLARQGIFEPAEATPVGWAEEDQVERSGTRLRGTLIGIWIGTLILAGLGYFGWQYHLGRRHAEAAVLAAKARGAAFLGDYRTLVDAERLLHVARDKHPRSAEVLRLQIFVHAQRVLESGTRELGALRTAMLRAKQLDVAPSHRAVADAVMAAYAAQGDPDVALEQAGRAAAGQAELLYLVGRLHQRAGNTAAAERNLVAAVAAAQDLLGANLSLAELQQQTARESEALRGFEQVIARAGSHTRARLWRAYLSAPQAEPARILGELETLSKLAHAGAASDRILWSLTRARILERTGQRPQAVAALRQALQSGATDAQLLTEIANLARSIGQSGLAQQAATYAVSVAPRQQMLRLHLAEILIERHNGGQAFALLANLAASEPVLRLRARAALETGDPQLLRPALEALEAQLAVQRADLGAQSLRLRLAAALDPDPKFLAEAKALLLRRPENLDVLRAVGEIALALGSKSDASSALKQLASLAPADAEAHHLLGRARRMAADAAGARASFERALALSPSFPAALAALGALCLDLGDYARAVAIFEQLSAESPLSGRLGLIESLIGLGQLDDAQRQLGGVPESLRDDPATRETAARLALARGKPKHALERLAPLLRSAPAQIWALQGDALRAAEQWTAATAAYEKALELDDALPEALLGRAQTLLRARSHSAALELLIEAKSALAGRLRPTELRARHLTLLGQAYVARGKKKDMQAGRDALRQALELEPEGRHAPAAKRALDGAQ
jgi:tetratricopeptide (TPR) repeat protein